MPNNIPSSFLDKIRDGVLIRINKIQITSPLKRNHLDFCKIFEEKREPIIIAEIKYASPSRGLIYQGASDSVAIAHGYISQGAAALSILTEPDYFKGNITSIHNVRQALPNSHILLKDFVLSEIQIAQALVNGANAVLLIVAFLKPNRLVQLYNYAIDLGLTPLIEVHTLAELEIALSLNPKIIGINNRNLQTLKIDLAISKKLIRRIPQDVYVICESGIENYHQIREMCNLGFDGFLIGSKFMQAICPGDALRSLLGECKDAN